MSDIPPTLSFFLCLIPLRQSLSLNLSLPFFNKTGCAVSSGAPLVPSTSVRGLEVHAATTSFYVDVGNPDSCPRLYSKYSYPFTNSPAFYCFKQLIKGAEAMA